MDVELPDGTVVTDVPDGITQAELLARVQKMNAPKPPSFGDRFSTALNAIGKMNPVGLATTGMGMAQEGLGKVGKIAGGGATDLLAGHVPPEVAGAAGAVAEVAVPAAAGGMVGKAVGQPILESGGKRLMQSAIKPSSDDLIAGLGQKSNAAKAIQTMLDENINVTPAGAAALKMKITELHREVANKIANSPKTVDKAYVASEVNKVLTKFRTQVANKADTDAILKTWSEFNSRFGNKIPVQEAFAMKSGTQNILSGKYGEMDSAATEAEN